MAGSDQNGQQEQTGAPIGSPMERQGELIRELAQNLLISAKLTEQWRTVAGAFVADGSAWEVRVLVTDADGTSRGGGVRFADESQFTLLLDALQDACAQQAGPMISIRLDAQRDTENLDRISISSQINYEDDPGAFDGEGLTPQRARDWLARFADCRAPLPQWVHDRAQQA